MAQGFTLNAYLGGLVQLHANNYTLNQGSKGRAYACAEDFVLDQGTLFEPEGLTACEEDLLLKAIDLCRVGRFVQKQCFYNSQMVVLGDPSGQLGYVEGFAVGRTIPVHHGWITINGKVVDLTWRTPKPNHVGRLKDRIFGQFPEHWEYLGVPICRDFILSRLRATHSVGTLIMNWEQDYPLFKWERRKPFNYKKFELPKEEDLVQLTTRTEKGEDAR